MQPLPVNPFTQPKIAILILDLAFFVPLAFIEICVIQKFKIDKLFLMTAIFYTTCFSLRLYFATSL